MSEEKIAVNEQIAALTATVEKMKSVIGGEGPTAGASSIHVDQPLSDFSVKVVQEDSEFKASKILSNFNSKHRSDQYYYYEPAYFMVNQVVARAEGAEAAMAKYGVARKSFTTEVYGLKQPVSDETVANADKAIDRIYEDATAFIVRQFLLNKEKALASALLAPAIWSTDLTGQVAAVAGEIVGGAFQQFNEATSKPLDILDKAFEMVQLRSGLRPNTLVMQRTVFSAIKRNTSVKTIGLYTSNTSTNDDAILSTMASHLGIQKEDIHILDVVEPASAATINGVTYAITTMEEGYASDAGETAVLTNQFIGGKGLLLMHVDKKSNGMYSATAAVCVQWTGLYPDGGDFGNLKMQRYRENALHSEMVEGSTAFSYHVVAPALGAYLDQVIA